MFPEPLYDVPPEIAPESVSDVTPETAPAAVTARPLAVLRANVPEPPPMVTSWLFVPVPMFTAKFELLFRLTAAPVIVRPPAPWIKPLPEFTPTAVTAPAFVTEKLAALMRFVNPVPKLMPFVVHVASAGQEPATLARLMTFVVYVFAA